VSVHANKPLCIKKKHLPRLEFERLKDEYFYPLFLKKDIFNLPNTLTIRTEIE